MKKVIAIIGSGMMGSALAFPAAENGHEVRLVGTHLDRDIIDECRRSNKHPKFDRAFPVGVKYYQIEEYREAVAGADFVIGGVSSFGVDWFLNEILVNLDPRLPVLSVTKGLINLEDGASTERSARSAAPAPLMNWYSTTRPRWLSAAGTPLPSDCSKRRFRPLTITFR